MLFENNASCHECIEVKIERYGINKVNSTTAWLPFGDATLGEI